MTAHITDSGEVHHIKNVLRLKPQNQIIVFNGRGQEALATIMTLSRNAVKISIDQTIVSETIERKKLILACAIPKKAKFESIIEKSTELGVDEIIPLKTQRTIFEMGEKDVLKKKLRYQTVAINAAKQSHRSNIPLIHPIISFKDSMKVPTSQDKAFIFCLIGERKNLRSALQELKNPLRLFFFIGPEGDFTGEEIQLALQSGCQPVSLGPNVLKVDTAVVSVISFTKLYLDE